MTKILLSGFFCLLLSFSAEACRPAPFPECTVPTIKIDYPAYLWVYQSVHNYQSRLSGGIIRPENANSCFDNHFAVHYGSIFKSFISKSKGLACQEQIDVIKRNFLHLISTETEEFRALRNEGYQNNLREDGVRVRTLVQNLFGI